MASGPPGNPVFCGTSAAAPHVAAVAALLMQRSSGLTSQQLRDLLTTRAVDLGTAGFDFTFGFGRVDAFASFPNPPTPQSPSGGQVISTLTPTLIWSGGGNFSSLQINISKSPFGGCPGGPNCVYTSSALSAGTTSIQVPSGVLVAGTNYRWDVTAYSGVKVWI